MASYRKSHRTFYARWVSVGGFVVGIILLVIGCAPSASEQTARPLSSVSVTPTPTLSLPEPTLSNPSPSVTDVPSINPSPVATQDSVPQLPPAPPIPVPPAAAPPTHLAYPARGISIPTHPMDGSSYVLDPPPNGDSYWLNNYGLAGSGSTDTVYVIGHSCYGEGCTDEAFPFNRLSEGVAPGQIITVSTANGVVDYQVTDSFIIDKNSTPAEKRGTWDSVPGRLVLIGCYTEDPEGSNVIVFASMIEK